MSDWLKQQSGKMDVPGFSSGFLSWLFGKGRKAPFKDRMGLSLASAIELRKIQTALRDGWSVVETISVPVAQTALKTLPAEPKVTITPPILVLSNESKWADAKETVKTVATIAVSNTTTTNTPQEKSPQVPEKPKALPPKNHLPKDQLEDQRNAQAQNAWYARQTATSSKGSAEETDLAVLFPHPEPPRLGFDENLRQKVRWPSESTQAIQVHKPTPPPVMANPKTRLVELPSPPSNEQGSRVKTKAPSAAPVVRPEPVREQPMPPHQPAQRQVTRPQAIQTAINTQPASIQSSSIQPASVPLASTQPHRLQPSTIQPASTQQPRVQPPIIQPRSTQPSLQPTRQELQRSVEVATQSSRAARRLLAKTEQVATQPRFATEDLANELMKRLFANTPTLAEQRLPNDQQTMEQAVQVHSVVSYHLQDEPEFEPVSNPIDIVHDAPTRSTNPLLLSQAFSDPQMKPVPLAERNLKTVPAPNVIPSSVSTFPESPQRQHLLPASLVQSEPLTVRGESSLRSFDSFLPKVSPSDSNPYKAKLPESRPASKTFHYNPGRLNNENPATQNSLSGRILTQ